MSARGRATLVLAVMGWLAGAPAAAVQPDPAGRSPELAVVEIPKAVWADGKPLPAGSYRLRPATSLPTFAAGAKPCGTCWIEFVQDGVVVGREQATIVASEEADTVARGPRPGPNSTRVDVLHGGSHVRVWINRGALDYIINLPSAP
jgi:hypothetical protein